MGLSQSVLRNLGFLSIAQFVGTVSGVFTVILLARFLGPETYGILGFGSAILAFMGIFTVLGTDAYGAREIARAPEAAGTIIGPLLTLRLGLAALAFLFLLVFLYGSGRSEVEKSVLALQGAGVFVTALTLDYAFQGMRRMEFNAARQSASALLILAAVWLFVGGPDDVLRAAGIYPLVGAVVVGVLFIYARRAFAPFRYGQDPAQWRRAFAAILPLAVTGTMHAVILNTDVLMLGLMRSNLEVGLYAAAVKIAVTTMVPAGLVAAAFYPELAKCFGDKDAMRNKAVSFIGLLFVAGAPLPCLIAVMPGQTIGVLFGEAFLPATGALSIMMISVLVTHFRMSLGTPLVAWNAEFPHMVVSVGGAAVNVVLNGLMIPHWGIQGAVLASLISQCLMLAGFFIVFLGRARVNIVAGFLRGAGCVAVPALATPLVMRNTDAGQLLPGPLGQLVVGGLVFAVICLPLAYLLVLRHRERTA